MFTTMVDGRNHNRIDLTGNRFGMLVVLFEDGRTNDGKIKWRCQCDCGKTHSVSGKHLRKKSIKSCGCDRGKGLRTHGLSHTQAHKHWIAMLVRCNSPNRSRWKDYGGRGITVCDRWVESFENFYADMGDPPVGYTLDREDNEKSYSPDNCRWATAKTQGRNRRNNRLIEFQGCTKTLAEWAESLGVTSTTLKYRIDKGWDLEKALNQKPAQIKLIEWNGKSQSLNQWARDLCIKQNVLWGRLYLWGWSVERAFTTRS